MFASPAFAQAAAGPAGGAGAFLIQVVPLVLLFVIFWFLIIRPQQKRMKDHRDMVAAVKRGDEVVTGGGLIGKVVKVGDDEVEVELAPGTKVRVVKATLSSVTPRSESKAVAIPGEPAEIVRARELLGVKKGATASAVREAWRKKVAQAHPDKGGSDERAEALNAARDLLLNDMAPAANDAKA